VCWAFLAIAASAAERELDTGTPPSSASEIKTPIDRVFPEEKKRDPLFPVIRDRIQEMPAFISDSTLEARYRTAYIRQDRTSDILSEAWAMGGSLYYRSGWLADAFSVELEGFTSQPIMAEDSKPGTQLLQPVQDGYSVLGIANGKLRHRGIELTGYRQYLDLPYINRQDSRMTPSTFEAITLSKPRGEFRFSAGYSWNVKLRNSDEFRSFTKAIGLGRNRGLGYGGVLWSPNDDIELGVIAAAVPDLFSGLYSEIGVNRDLAGGVEGRFDAQFTYQWDVGDDLLGDLLNDSWNVGGRFSASYAGAMLRLGASVTGSGGSIDSLYGTNPSYVDLMQRTFTAENEKALLVSASYDLSELGAHGLSAIVNFVAAFDGKRLGQRRDAQELNLTLDYRISEGWLESFWLRLRGAWLHEDSSEQDGIDVRVILRYDIPVI
jgi:hypothetical protein